MWWPISYLSGVATPALEDLAHDKGIGLLIQPGNNYYERVDRYPYWGGDNGAFTTKPGGFNPHKFRHMITQPELAARRDRCLFVTAPDVLQVAANGTVTGDAAATIDQLPEWSAEIRRYGFPVAMVAQDGLQDMLSAVPWAMFDVLFIGGSTEWKLSSHAQQCTNVAKARGKRVHMGRVNSFKRLSLAVSWRIETVDGTFLKYGPKVNLPRLIGWLDKIRSITTC